MTSTDRTTTMTKPIEEWVTTQIAPAKRILVYKRAEPQDSDGMPKGGYSPFWLVQELRSVNGTTLPAPFATRVIASRVDNATGSLVPIDPTEFGVAEW
jgi:hypothetical protein